MRVLGYEFEEEDEAQRALSALVDRFELAAEDAHVARLADENHVLAVRAREDNLDAVKELLTEHGGEQLTDVDERWTRPRSDSLPQ